MREENLPLKGTERKQVRTFVGQLRNHFSDFAKTAKLCLGLVTCPNIATGYHKDPLSSLPQEP